jgi:AcrR family transcriptional regulator
MARPRTRTDAEVLSAALRAVATHGVAQLTLADVAGEAGLAPSTLAERFGSKQALLLAAARFAAGEVRLERRGGSPLEDAVDGLVALASGVSDRRAFAHSLALLQLDVADAGFRSAAAEHFAGVRRQLVALLREAVDAGELDADPAALARALQVAYNGALVVWAVSGEGELAESLRADLEAVLIRSRSRARAGPACAATARGARGRGPPRPGGCA